MLTPHQIAQKSVVTWTACLCFSLLSDTAQGQAGVVSREEALMTLFPSAQISSEHVFLTNEQENQINALSRGKLQTKLFARYVATRDGRIVGRAYIDTHIVRTKRESLLIALDTQGRVKRINVTAFLEPPEYIASERWLNQYKQKRLSDQLAIHRSIRPIAGATLTTQAVNAAVRRVMALDQVLEQESRTRGAP